MATLIHNITELQNISLDLAGDYEIANDIPAGGVAFTPLGTFTGTLAGKDYRVSNLTITISGSGYKSGALITVNQGTVENLTLGGCQISVTSTNAHAYAGGVAHENDGGTIRKCFTTGNITAISAAENAIYSAVAGGICVWNENGGTIDKSRSSASITATSTKNATAGGLAGMNIATISESYATGSVTAISTYSGGGTATTEAGGLVANNGYTGWDGTTGTILNCFAQGNVSATGGTVNYAGGLVSDNQTADSTITNAYSIGVPTGEGGIGGLCRTNSGTITNCFWDIETSGTETSDGGTGKTTSQMKTLATYTGWNFAGIWHIASNINSGYPSLGNITRGYTTPVIYDNKGRTPKGARIEARRNDTGHIVETAFLGHDGRATFTELPNDVGVSFYSVWGGSASAGKTQLLFSTIIGVSEGGTGSSNALDGRTNLGIGTEDSPQFKEINVGDASDTTIARAAAGRATIEGVAVVRGPASATDNRLVKTDGTTGDLVQQTGITADDSNNVSGVAKLTTTSDIELGNASDTTLHRESAGNVSIEGKLIYRAEGIDVPVTDGGTGASTTNGARTNLELDKKDIYSCDFGLNWTDLGVIAGERIYSMAYLGNGIVLAGEWDIIWRSTDYGATWTDIDVSALLGGEYIHCIAYLGNGIVTFGDSDGAIFRSTDYGLTWTDVGPVGSGYPHYAMVYLGNGIVVSGDADSHVFRSTNFGLTWTDLGEITSLGINAMAYLGNGVVILGGDDKHIFKSTDYGANWADDYNLDYTIYSLAYLGNNIVLIGTLRNIFRSTDGGDTWTDLGEISANSIMAITYLGNGVVVCGDASNHVFRSTNYGVTWTDLGVISSDAIYSMAYLGNGIVLLGDEDGHIFRSTSAFQVWQARGSVASLADVVAWSFLLGG